MLHCYTMMICLSQHFGAQVAAALALGAAGAVLGTRLVVTEESLYPAHWKVCINSCTCTYQVGNFETFLLSFLPPFKICCCSWLLTSV